MKSVFVLTLTMLGAIIGVTLFAEIGPVFGFRHMEGSSAIFGFLFGLPVGTVVFGLSAYRYARHLDRRGLGRAVIYIWLVTILLAVSGVVYELWRTSDYLSSNRTAASIQFEISVPDGTSLTGPDAISISMESPKETRSASLGQVTPASGGAAEGLIRGYIDLYRVTPERVIKAKIGNVIHEFRLELPARPRRQSEFGEWKPADRGPVPKARIRYKYWLMN
ncbi:hypothetical protein [Tardiphaga sp. 42S5]|uniref:hypothetical protein n=1 Tax=Tardiphaga sp. 42S5 TaxID=1404799 RepID=UPI002A5B0C3F|nr:hypothetical protein [Tardiphaga sp. 42S5]WPO43612.1 hypothetical protein SFY93_10865 [Tardiphaga sp. 42S5]